jgi:crotonobetainyl-CoA:carnitine CoA-transferase CaiB-like acyl-CoA transferase
MLPYSDTSWSDLYHAVGHEQELPDPWFQKRLQNPRPVYAGLAKILAERTTAEWLELAAELGIPAGPVPMRDEIIDEPRLHRGVITEHEHPVVGRFRQISPPVRFGETKQKAPTPAPLLGQDTEAVLREIGLTDEQILQLIPAAAP